MSWRVCSRCSGRCNHRTAGGIGGEVPHRDPDERNAAGLYEGEITFTYCTEFIVLKDAERADALALRAYLESIGDSAVVVDDDDIIKCHVHTDNPGDALQNALQHGALTKIKIENMREQHADNQKAVRESMTGGFQYAPVDPSNAYGFVAVCAGDGVEQLFQDLGVTNVVKGGQTMNPSTDGHPVGSPCHSGQDRLCSAQQQEHHHGCRAGHQPG